MIWTAGFRSAVISPYEQIKLTEPRGFADQTVRQVLHMAGGGERLLRRRASRPATTSTPPLDSGDGMHLNDEGAQAMANAVDLGTLVP